MLKRLPPKEYRSLLPRRPCAFNSQPYPFAYARTALKFGIQSLGLVHGDSILVPETICDVLLHPLQSLHIRPIYYPLTDALEPMWDKTRDLLDGSVKAILMAHYFGQPQDIPRFQRFCQNHGLFLIEDNAHGYGGTFQDQLLGTFGDIGIASPRKSWPTANGGYLYFNDRQSIDLPPLSGLPLEPMNLWMKNIRAQLKNFMDRIPCLRTLSTAGRLSQEAYREAPIPDWSMDQGTDHYVANQNLAAARQLRQQIYTTWHDWAVSHQLTPVLHRLSPGSIPLVFAAYTATPDTTRQWLGWGRRQCIDVHTWPTLPRELVHAGGAAYERWQRMICMPIHTQMNLKYLQNILINITGPNT